MEKLFNNEAASSLLNTSLPISKCTEDKIGLDKKWSGRALSTQK